MAERTWMTPDEAAGDLKTSAPTVRELVKRGVLKGVEERHGRRTFVKIDRKSVEDFVGLYTQFVPRFPYPGIYARAVTARSADSGDSTSGDPFDERDHLRAEVARLREVILRLISAADLNQQAESLVAHKVDRLLEDLNLSERVDALRRSAAAELREALAQFAVPGHPGDI